MTFDYQSEIVRGVPDGAFLTERYGAAGWEIISMIPMPVPQERHVLAPNGQHGPSIGFYLLMKRPAAVAASLAA